MKFVKGRWVKYSNRIFPRYERQHCLVRINKIKSIAFYDFENAVIFEELIKIKNQRKRQ